MDTQVIELPNAGVRPAFIEFPKIARLSRDIVITEKIDGTNAQVYIGDDGLFLTGSRTRWITPSDDNYGFSRWAHEHQEELMKLGPGSHFGEWWGGGIQRGYNLPKGEKRFSLFNTGRWVKANPPDVLPELVGKQQYCPGCCHVVPVLYTGPFDTNNISNVLWRLRENGSVVSPGFLKPEGIVVFHTASGELYKKTLERDEAPKSLAA